MSDWFAKIFFTSNVDDLPTRRFGGSLHDLQIIRHHPSSIYDNFKNNEIEILLVFNFDIVRHEIFSFSFSRRNHFDFGDEIFPVKY